MSPDQEHRLEETFSAARDLPPEKRAAFLDQACGGSQAFRQEIQSLLSAHDQAGRLLQPTIALSMPDALVGKSGDRIGRYTPQKMIGEDGSTRSSPQLALFQVMLLALAFLLTGCIGVLPFPQFSNQPTHGTKLLAKDTAFIRLGTTSSSELFGTLGTTCLCDPRQRAVWYQTGPYFAYYYSGRYYDVLDLATTTITTANEPAIEESWHWRGMAKAALGDFDGAVADFRTSLEWHPQFTPTLTQLQLLGVEP